jgi:hypothetical protein
MNLTGRISNFDLFGIIINNSKKVANASVIQKRK